MNSEEQIQLEAAMDRELKALPNLRAPDTLAARVMARIEQQQAPPWYRQAWQSWPLPVQAVATLVLLAAFGGVCFGSWYLVRTPDFAVVAGKAGSLFSGFSALWNALGLLKSGVWMAVKSLHPALLLGCGMALALGYATCLGLGTVYVRLGFARR